MANVIRYRLRSDTGANWTSRNPILLRGEPGFDETERRFKMGDGVKKWNELSYEKDPDIVNALNSDRTDAALSAAQGKVLKGSIDDLSTNVSNLQTDIPKYSVTGFDANNEPTGFSIVGGASYAITRDGSGKLTKITSGDKVWTAQYDAQGRFTGLR